MSGGLVVYLVSRVGSARVAGVLGDTPPSALAAVVILQLAGVALSTLKWRSIIRASRPAPPYRWLLGSYLSGQFAGNLLPTAVGGDAVRIVQLAGRLGSPAAAASTVFFERLTGFLALNVLATAGLVALATAGRPTGVPVAAVAALTATLGALSAAALSVLARPRWLSGLRRVLPGRLAGKAGAAGEVFVAAAPRGRVLGRVLLLSLAFQASWALMHAAGGTAMGIDVPIFTYVVLATLTDVLGLVPVFFNNVGAREIVFTIVLPPLGVAEDRALALALLILTGRLVVGLLGGLAVGVLGWGSGTPPGATEIGQDPLRPSRRTRRRDR